MKLYELFDVLDEDMELWVNSDGEFVDRYDNKNSIDEEYNDYNVTYITRNGFGGFVVEIEK